MKKILIINGPNLNLLGDREPEIYGNKSLKDIENECKDEFSKLELFFYQSNSESEIIEYIHSSSDFSGLIINAGAFTHTSIAIHDALKAVKIPKIEVHISNIYSREEFRKKSFISPVVDGIIAGFGTSVYKLAIFAITKLKND
ncbi:MAG: type II 3-dehydroquinate dehydratase [Alphaproteobacteria bacterium]|nr:type II 3-dehydroquinate dehydratase [Alphaproteobacteria bacterium]|tara:strand:+ start:212 stop:640 length:429 start_codon:yes stop_codon:yes gene_type:complete